MTTKLLMEESQCILVYNLEDGFSWVRYGEISLPSEKGETLDTTENPKSIYSTIPSAFAASVRKGHNPTHHVSIFSLKSPPSVPLKIDQADHWKSLMKKGLL